jgi:hypothetical protein
MTIEGNISERQTQLLGVVLSRNLDRRFGGHRRVIPDETSRLTIDRELGAMTPTELAVQIWEPPRTSREVPALDASERSLGTCFPSMHPVTAVGGISIALRSPLSARAYKHPCSHVQAQLVEIVRGKNHVDETRNLILQIMRPLIRLPVSCDDARDGGLINTALSAINESVLEWIRVEVAAPAA